MFVFSLVSLSHCVDPLYIASMVVPSFVQSLGLDLFQRAPTTQTVQRGDSEPLSWSPGLWVGFALHCWEIPGLQLLRGEQGSFTL